MAFVTVIMLLLVIHLLSLNIAFVACDLVNLRVYTEIYLNESLVRLENSVIFTNNGSEALSHYPFNSNGGQVVFAKFYNQDGTELSHEVLNTSIYNVALDETVEDGHQYKIISNFVYSQKIAPAMKKCMFDEKQVLKYEDNVHFYSPFHTESLEVQINVEKMIESTILESVYYVDLPPYSVHNATVYYESNQALIVVKRLQRTIEVSHFGKISIMDISFLENIGCKVSGPFAALNRIGLYKHLPSSAANVDFYDVLGKISSWKLYDQVNSILFWFHPRYPLLGGWKTNYIVKYTVPVYENLYIFQNNHYLLKIRGVDHVVNDSLIEQVALKVILPEGAEINSVQLPDYLKFVKLETHCQSAFCVFGRPTLNIEGTHLYDIHSDPNSVIEVKYYFFCPFLLRTPFAISVYILCIFLFVMFVTRLYY